MNQHRWLIIALAAFFALSVLLLFNVTTF